MHLKSGTDRVNIGTNGVKFGGRYENLCCMRCSFEVYKMQCSFSPDLPGDIPDSLPAHRVTECEVLQLLAYSREIFNCGVSYLTSPSAISYYSTFESIKTYINLLLNLYDLE
jgi:hypothetical protein